MNLTAEERRGWLNICYMVGGGDFVQQYCEYCLQSRFKAFILSLAHRPHWTMELGSNNTTLQRINAELENPTGRSQQNELEKCKNV